jgi:hypothetical protein
MDFQAFWDKANAALAPTARWFQDVQNAPVWVVDAVGAGVVVWFAGVARGRAKEQRAARDKAGAAAAQAALAALELGVRHGRT